MVISKQKYEQLVNQSVELMKQKSIIQKLRESITKKCARVKELNKIISQHQYLLKKSAQKGKLETTKVEIEEQTKRRKECSVSLGQMCIYVS